MRVDAIGEGTLNDPIRPDLSEDTNYRIVGYYTEEGIAGLWSEMLVLQPGEDEDELKVVRVPPTWPPVHVIERYDEENEEYYLQETTSMPVITGFEVELIPDLEACAYAARIAVVDKVRGEELSEESIERLAPLFPSWAPGINVAKGQVYQWDGTLAEAIQPHTTQSDWTPDVATSLWKLHRKKGVAAPWVQPQGEHNSYQVGELVTHNGKTWRNDVANNVWEPGVHGWVEV